MKMKSLGFGINMGRWKMNECWHYNRDTSGMRCMDCGKQLEIKLSKYGLFPRHELISMGMVSPFGSSDLTEEKKNV